MELRVLRYFLAVAEEGNITWAAELLQISQPTLSRQLKQLEDELGVTLFTRGRHNITLTREGCLLRDRAQAIVELADKTEHEVSNGCSGELDGEISVSCGDVRAVEYLTARMAAFRRLHPRVRFVMVSTTADVIQERLDQGLSDVALMTEPVDMARFDFMRLDAVDEWGVMIRDDDPLVIAGAATARPEDLVDRPLLMPFRPQVRAELLSWFGPLRDRVQVSCIFNLPLNAAMAVRQGVGAALCYDVGQVGEGLRFLPLAPHLEARSVVAWKRSSMHAPAVEAFIAFLREGLAQ
ncbi:LysR family transcriptional regulator [Bifidobacterium reuteri]|uniref:LysR family transcriptional regulator n=1 Tax=Bifidobacterium reuteri TaxID=983706 RepID=A0A5J5E3L7_9BIFI|nr:LysR family transcriptional regulator [Bifidobacterium reuteri]KAA8823688.1 LysR family transcriptional regulator [Bifidobacterium reuteri]